MVTLEEFHQYFTQSILSDAESRTLLRPQSFFETVCEDLVSIGDLTKNYTYADYVKKGTEAFGYDFDDERGVLTILNHQYFQDDEIQTLTRTQLDSKFTRMKSFLKKCFEGFHSYMEETSDAYSMAYNVKKYYDKNLILKVRFMLLTDGRVTRTLTDISSEVFLNIPVEFRIVDIEYLHKIYSTATGIGEFEVQVDLPYLKINQKSDSYESYLAVVSGNMLVAIYEEFGQKLFEQNVRTFLQFRGGVNRGLRNTIETAPEMFFAYNNGITATASSVEFGENSNISLIKNFQIVNGGQTTSAIYSASKVSKIDVSNVSVQMKLSVVKDVGRQDEFVSKVAEYANTQNKINNSDFFSNSPFHKDMKDYSTRIFAPATEGSQRRTHWYYERVRGEYLNNQAYLSAFDKRKFLLENPKHQLIDKTLLSKAENSWNQKPDIVSKGAQDSFKKFADNISEVLENDNLAITQSYFRDAIAKIIMFRTVEKLITKSLWYDGGFRAQTVTYTIAYFSAMLHEMALNLNFNNIWERQALPESLIDMLDTIAEKIYHKITSPPAGYANISQWTKNVKCWESVKEIKIKFENIDHSLFVDSQEIKYIEKEEKKAKVVDTGIEKQIEVLGTPLQAWKKLNTYYSEDKSALKLSSMHTDILLKMANGEIALPSEKQSAILYSLKKTAEGEGVKLI
ncbi:AIPR family protein [Flavobacterium cerinum]|uniref:Abortive phage infection protein n=1 Tax=Flavobacterium cerinum TaxID=2502784 RepID=A0A3S3U1U9_9FLAO|nr:AIPR family protein [Flavobacterium cerinum]RWX02208.1 abortive phage infection protein [Flavobacterium cerinum]